jgi:cell division septation protein DedD
MSIMLTFRARKAAGPWVLRAALAVFLALLVACSREQQDWRSAEAADTVESYGQFLNKHPESELVTQARTRVTQLAEEREWQQVSSTDTADAYRQFLAQHPNGKWAQEARIRIQNFALNGLPPAGPPMAAAPEQSPVTSAPGTTSPPNAAVGGAAVSNGATASATAASAATAIAAPGELAHAAGSSEIPAGTSAKLTSTPAPASPAPPRYSTPYVSAPAAAPTNISSTGGSSVNAPNNYGVQLGAFGSQSAASNEWQQLTQRFGAQLRGLTPHVVAASTPTGPLFRLQAQVADEAHARSLCDVLRKQSQACVPVLPR